MPSILAGFPCDPNPNLRVYYAGSSQSPQVMEGLRDKQDTHQLPIWKEVHKKARQCGSRDRGREQ